MSRADQFWRKALLFSDATINDALRNLDEVAVKIVFVIEKSGVLIGTISDGDIRRGLLKGLNLHSPIISIIHRNAVVAPANLKRPVILQMMIAKKVPQIPIVDEQGRVIGVHLWDEVALPLSRPNAMVIMAGGLGTRLRPHTYDCPKPLLEIDGKPMLEHIIDRAKLSGLRHFIIAINYLGHMIEAYFGNGNRLDVQIEYLREQGPLGTAGALGLLPFTPEMPLLVTNGDVITDVRYGELLDFHAEQTAAATMAVRLYERRHNFGVVQLNGIDVVGLEEKPIVRDYINAGIYVLEPAALNVLRRGEHCDMPTLLQNLRNRNDRVVAYPIHEPWIDVGRLDDLYMIQKNKN